MEYFDLSLMRGSGDGLILHYMCSSMGYPHTEIDPLACTSSNLDFSPFDVDYKLVVELGEPVQLIIP